MFFTVDVKIILEAVEYTKNGSDLGTLQELIEIFNIISCYGLEKYVRFDLSMIGQIDYYTGLIFHVYTREVGHSIVNGGRYDNLVAQFGVNLPAVGFAIGINSLMEALTKF